MKAFFAVIWAAMLMAVGTQAEEPALVGSLTLAKTSTLPLGKERLYSVKQFERPAITLAPVFIMGSEYSYDTNRFATLVGKRTVTLEDRFFEDLYYRSFKSNGGRDSTQETVLIPLARKESVKFGVLLVSESASSSRGLNGTSTSGGIGFMFGGKKKK